MTIYSKNPEDYVDAHIPVELDIRPPLIERALHFQEHLETSLLRQRHFALFHVGELYFYTPFDKRDICCQFNVTKRTAFIFLIEKQRAKIIAQPAYPNAQLLRDLKTIAREWRLYVMNKNFVGLVHSARRAI